MTSRSHFPAGGRVELKLWLPGGAMGATGDAEQPRGPSGAERGGPEPGDASAAGQLVLTVRTPRMRPELGAGKSLGLPGTLARGRENAAAGAAQEGWRFRSLTTWVQILVPPSQRGDVAGSVSFPQFSPLSAPPSACSVRWRGMGPVLKVVGLG